MRTIKLLIICMLIGNFFSQKGIAQNISQEQRDRLNAQKIAFFTQQLHLTPKESEQFWPVYNEYQRKRNEILMEKRKANIKFRQNMKTMSDKEMEQAVDDYVLLNQKEADLLVAYHQEFKKVLPIRKVMKLYQTENQFKAFLLRQIRDNQERHNKMRMNPNRQFNKP